MTEMMFVRHYLIKDLQEAVNAALADGFEYVETHSTPYEPAGQLWVLVVLRKD